MGSVTRTEKTLLIVIIVLSLLYISLIPVMKAVPGLYVLKDIPDLTLAILAIIAIAGIRGKLLFVTYILCGLAGLALDLPIENSFILGLVLFLLGHIGYIVAFSRDFKWQPSRLWLVIFLIVYAVIMGVVMQPFLGSMMIPVYCYIVVIITMCIFAALRKSGNNYILLGALLFLASDSALAVNKFVTPVPAEAYIVMFTYFAAQFFILYGFLREKYSQST